jgi:hypothetical protein
MVRVAEARQFNVASTDSTTVLLVLPLVARTSVPATGGRSTLKLPPNTLL